MSYLRMLTTGSVNSGLYAMKMWRVVTICQVSLLKSGDRLINVLADEPLTLAAWLAHTIF